MRQPGPVEVILAAPEDLRLVLQASECRRVQHAVAVDLKGRTVVGPVASARVSFRVKSPVESVQHLPNH